MGKQVSVSLGLKINIGKQASSRQAKMNKSVQPFILKNSVTWIELVNDRCYITCLYKLFGMIALEIDFLNTWSTVAGFI